MKTHFGLLKIFFPKWNFFDQIENQLVARFRFRKASAELSDWFPLIEWEKRNWWNLFYNPVGNYHLKQQVLVEQLMNEASLLSDGKSEEIENLAEFYFLSNLCRRRIRQKYKEAVSHFEFKIVVCTAHLEDLSDAFQSREIEV